MPVGPVAGRSGWCPSGGFRHFLAVGPIDAAVAEAAFEGVEAVGELALDPFQIGQAGAVGEFVEHPCRDQIRNVLDLRGFFAERAHGISLGSKG